ncbi:MAG TPA: methylmalonyl-CoA epimerase [Planctomycetes bacterium]|nr:methylmalonyl-CoA epimerase [Planctomycetota bacterium]|tara:strand:- start:195 stop:599 length:405 start_codon:yes stop_codon:yes gene_type:complete
MASRIDHLGIAVRDLEASEALFGALLGTESQGREVVETEGVEVSFFQVGESRFELLRPTKPESAIARHLEKRGEGIHHVCLKVDDIAAEVARLREAGFQFVGEAPRPGAGGCQVAFLHPKSAGGILVELSQGEH